MRLDELRTSAPQTYVFGDGPKRDAINVILERWPQEHLDLVNPIVTALGMVDPQIYRAPGDERAVAARIATQARDTLFAGKPFDFPAAARKAVQDYDAQALAWAGAVIARDDLEAELRATVHANDEMLCVAWSERVAKVQREYARIARGAATLRELEALRAGGDDLKRWQNLTTLEMEYDFVAEAWEALRHLNGYDRTVEDPESRFQFDRGQSTSMSDVRAFTGHIVEFAVLHGYRLWLPTRANQAHGATLAQC
jgi:hypothetical protein